MLRPKWQRMRAMAANGATRVEVSIYDLMDKADPDWRDIDRKQFEYRFTRKTFTADRSKRWPYNYPHTGGFSDGFSNGFDVDPGLNEV